MPRIKRRNPPHHIYWEWLCRQAGNSTDRRELYNCLHCKEFVWFVPNDDNRMHDGIDLRAEFIHAYPKWTMEHLNDLPFISALEVLVALSRRLEFMTSIDSFHWVDKLLEHLGLDRMTGQLTDGKKEVIDGVLDELIWRQYNASGAGGFFPLRHPKDNQTKVEIWYQMHAWLEENYGH